jgi:hypothetical protein
MYDSIKTWVNVPYQIKPFDKRTGTGTKLFKDTVDSLCYPKSETELITDSTGAEVVSMTQLYIDGSTELTVLDNIIFENEERPIKKITSFYRNGVPDIKVVYL